MAEVKFDHRAFGAASMDAPELTNAELGALAGYKEPVQGTLSRRLRDLDEVISCLVSYNARLDQVLRRVRGVSAEDDNRKMPPPCTISSGMIDWLDDRFAEIYELSTQLEAQLTELEQTV